MKRFSKQEEGPSRSGRPVTTGMRWVDGGTFAMGSENFYPEEAPIRNVRVDGFWIDETPVTNREFARFVDSTGYKTVAETAPDPKAYPGMAVELKHPGSLLFQRTTGPVDIDDPAQWWIFAVGVNWRRPHGPESVLDGLEDHPVVHVAFEDAKAYAKWAAKSLPTEAEWEYAARGGLEGQEYAWGDELMPEGRVLANFWRGTFPFARISDGGWENTSPVRSYPANGFGLYDMIGNVWEWTSDWYAQPSVKKKERGSCCITGQPPRRDPA